MPISGWRTRRDPIDIADLGPIGIMLEAFRQFWSYSFHFLLIQVTLILPVVGLFAAVQNKLLVFQFKALPLSPSPPPHVLHLPNKTQDRLFLLSSSSKWIPHFYHPVVLVSLLATFAFEAVQGLSTAAIILSVGLIYAGLDVSFFGVLRSTIPILWLRLALTTLYNVFISHSIVLLETASLLLILRFEAADGSGPWWVIALKIFIGGTFGLLDLFLGVVFGVALGVSVLEEAYGWAAYKKALKLLEGKGRVAIWFHIVWSRTVPTVITFALNHRAVMSVGVGINKGDYRTWSPTPLQGDYLNAVLFVAWTTLFWQLSSLCAGVQYVSFKAFHHESIADSTFCEERAKVGYKPIGLAPARVEAVPVVSRSSATSQTESLPVVAHL